MRPFRTMIYAGQKYKLNTFIEGISEADANASVLGSRLGVSSSSIKNIKWEANNCTFHVAVNYSPYATNNTDLFNAFDQNLMTKYEDIGGKVLTVGAGSKGFSVVSNVVREYLFPFATTLKGRTDGLNYIFVLYNGTFRKLYMPLVTSILDKCEIYDSANMAGGRIYVNAAMKTNSGGGEHSVFTQWRSKGVKVLFVTSFDLPLPIDNSYITGINAVSARFIQVLSNGNDIDQVLVYDSSYNYLYTLENDEAIRGLAPGSTTNFKMIVRDSNDKLSGYGSISISTPASSNVTDGLVGCYEFQETSVSTIKDLSGFISKPVVGSSGITTLSEGKIGTGFGFLTTTSYLQLKTPQVKSMCFWCKPTAYNNTTFAYLFDARSTANIYLYRTGSAGVAKFYVNGVSKTLRADNMTLNTWNHVYVEFTTPVTAGAINFMSANTHASNTTINGYLDLLVMYSKALSDAEILQNYNSGSGMTL